MFIVKNKNENRPLVGTLRKEFVPPQIWHTDYEKEGRGQLQSYLLLQSRKDKHNRSLSTISYIIKIIQGRANDHRFRPANSQGRLPDSFDYAPILVT